MNEIVNLPSSIKERLQEARSLAQSNRSSEAEQIVREAGRALATAHPEVCALLLAAEAGYRGIAAMHTESTTTTVRTEHKVLGVRACARTQTTTETKTLLKKLELY